MKYLIKRLKEWFVWFFCRSVDKAINSGATYEEVEQIVQAEVAKL